MLGAAPAPGTLPEWLDEHTADVAHALRADDDDVLRILRDSGGWEPEQDPEDITASRLWHAARQLGELTGAEVPHIAKTLYMFGYPKVVAD